MTPTAKDGVVERGILFTGEMVRALIEGRKTETRRPCTPSNYPIAFGDFKYSFVTSPENVLPSSRYGRPGDRLWVRETWARSVVGSVYYRADSPDANMRWRAPRFMPREASRMTLDITGVRVERLREITDAGARAEGVASIAEYRGLWNRINPARPWRVNPYVWVLTFRLFEVHRG